jgi:hypothetical protein
MSKNLFSKPTNILLTRIGQSSVARILPVIVLLAASGLHAQGYGSITGAVTDPSGAVIPGASVTMTQSDNGRITKATAGADGRFVFPTLPPAPYSISVDAAGFQGTRLRSL